MLISIVEVVEQHAEFVKAKHVSSIEYSIGAIISYEVALGNKSLSFPSILYFFIKKKLDPCNILF